jgi:hypothetical protein
MPSFQAMFMESKGKPIQYQGNTLVMIDHLPTSGCRAIQVVFESSNSRWRQGIRVKSEGKLQVNGQVVAGKKGMVLWEDTAPQTVEIELVGNPSTVGIYNAWDAGSGRIDAWHNGAAMIVEELRNGRRYRCNDGEPDDDFDDLIFRVERVE